MNHINKFPPEVILYGGTGQARAVRPIIEYYGSKVVAVFDDTENLKSPFPEVPVFKGMSALNQWLEKKNPAQIGFAVTIGNPHGKVRLALHEKLADMGLKPITIAHPTAFIAADAIVGEGCQILAGAIIAGEAVLGKCCILNNNAVAEHEIQFGDAVELATSATVLGLTNIGPRTLVGAGATVLSRLTICGDATIAAGSVVGANILDPSAKQENTTRTH